MVGETRGMVRKRKAEKGVATAKEDKTSNACSNATTREEKKPDVHSDHYGSPSKKSKSMVTSVVLRRSGRLINSILPSERKQVKPVVEHVNLDESEREEAPVAQQVNASLLLSEKTTDEEAPQVQKVITVPVLNERNAEEEAPPVQEVITVPLISERNVEEEAPQVQPVSTVSVVNERNLEDKVEYLVHAFGEFMSKTVKQVSKSPNEGPATYFNYKSLYIDSQKKIEDLMEENYQLVKKLEFALGKIEAYEKMKDSMCASKEVILLSNLEKSTEAADKLSPYQNCIAPNVTAPEAANDQKTSPKPKKTKHKVAPNAASGHKTLSPKQKKSNYKKKKAKS